MPQRPDYRSLDRSGNLAVRKDSKKRMDEMFALLGVCGAVQTARRKMRESGLNWRLRFLQYGSTKHEASTVYGPRSLWLFR